MPDILVAAAAGTYFLGYLTINQIVLRLFVLTGTLFYIAYYATAADTPLWVAIWTSVALLAANLYGLFLLVAGRSRWSLPKKLSDVYQDTDRFKSLTPGDFRALVRYARRETLDTPLIVSNEDHELDQLYYIVSGGAHVLKKGREFRLPPNVFIGEVAFLLQRSSAATISIDAGSDILVWDFDTLKRQSAKKQRFKLALEAVVARDLARKVAVAVSPDAIVRHETPLVAEQISLVDQTHPVHTENVELRP
ncbi:MAG: Crp/Fnr family transcriptional regulator [Paracoccaceae bacterium]